MSKIIVVSLAAYATFLRVFPFYAVALEIKKSLLIFRYSLFSSLVRSDQNQLVFFTIRVSYPQRFEDLTHPVVHHLDLGNVWLGTRMKRNRNSLLRRIVFWKRKRGKGTADEGEPERKVQGRTL